MTVKILGRDIYIYVIPDGDLVKMTATEDCTGFFKDDRIYLANSLQEDQRKRVLIHELCHAVFSISGLTNLLEDELEEAICDALETLSGTNL